MFMLFHALVLAASAFLASLSGHHDSGGSMGAVGAGYGVLSPADTGGTMPGGGH